MLYYINGKFVLSNEAKIPFSDGGFLYGDGLFETMRFDNRKIFCVLNHMNRLEKGLKVINLEIKYHKSELIKLLEKVIEKNNLNSGIIRLMITRGNSDTKLHHLNVPSVYISIKPFYELPSSPIKVVYLDEGQYPIIRFTPAIKSMNYIGNMLAKKDSAAEGAFEPIFYNKNKIITECAIRNIFYINNKTILTPSLDLGILPGVMREQIIQICSDLNYNIQECHIPLDNVHKMDEAFISSTGVGMLPCYWEGFKSRFHITNRIKKELFNRIKNK